MNNNFSSKDFLLRNNKSIYIYNEFSKKLPIIDYHCHLKPDEIYNNKKFNDLSEVWLSKDHYKWRLMRANGVPECLITGNSSSKQKFLAWVDTIERSPGNPLYHWSHMELSMYFGIELIINKKNAESIWECANRQLGETGYGARDFIRKSHVKLIGTTDSPLSNLKYHKLIENENINNLKVIPTLRLDSFFNFNHSHCFVEFSENYGKPLNTIEDYFTFINERILFFDKHGSCSADLGVGLVEWKNITTNPSHSFIRLSHGESLNEVEIQDLQTFVLIEVMTMIYEVGWVLQIHFGAIPSVNEEAFARLGRGTGFDSIVDQGNLSSSLLYLFNQVNNRQKLPKIVLYNVDRSKNSVIDAIASCFQDNEVGIKSKIQHGPAWWFQDTLRGNRRQLEDIADQGILMNFIGMTTDSRSFMSYARHDYFRRILCDLVGKWIEAGEMPDDDRYAKELIEAVSYKNAIDYFELPVLT